MTLLVAALIVAGLLLGLVGTALLLNRPFDDFNDLEDPELWIELHATRRRLDVAVERAAAGSEAGRLRRELARELDQVDEP